jgi:hypothetical protein
MIMTTVLASGGWEQEKSASNRIAANPERTVTFRACNFITAVILSTVAGSPSEAGTESKDPRTANIAGDVAGSSLRAAGVGRIPRSVSKVVDFAGVLRLRENIRFAYVLATLRMTV